MSFDDFLKKYGEIKTYAKSEHVFRQGDLSEEVLAVQSGIMKGYYLSQDGKEYIKSFIFEGDIIASLRAVYKNEPTSFGLICLEETVAVSIPFKALYEASKSNIALSNFLVEGLMCLSMKKEKREYDFLCLSAEERYKQLQEDRPRVLSRITQNDIARYLGITPVALSRIRKRMG
jgi:CRP-like cAMP-binding protein